MMTKIFSLLVLLSLSAVSIAQDAAKKKQGNMEKMHEEHMRCMRESKSSAECEKNMMEQCKLSHKECMQMMEEMEMNEMPDREGQKRLRHLQRISCCKARYRAVSQLEKS